MPSSLPRTPSSVFELSKMEMTRFCSKLFRPMTLPLKTKSCEDQPGLASQDREVTLCALSYNGSPRSRRNSARGRCLAMVICKNILKNRKEEEKQSRKGECREKTGVLE